MRPPFVPILGLLLGLPAPAGPAARVPRDPIDLNTATVTELMQLPRIGARTAARIVAWRQANGRFRRPEDLLAVKGIGEKAFLRLRPHLRTGEPPRPAEAP